MLDRSPVSCNSFIVIVWLTDEQSPSREQLFIDWAGHAVNLTIAILCLLRHLIIIRFVPRLFALREDVLVTLH